MKKYYIETYGCQMNEYDSLIAKNILEKEKADCVDTPEQADVILINTCAVRENAHTKILHRLDSLSHLHKQGKRIAVLGCLAQNEHNSLLAHQSVDYVFGPDSFRSLPLIFNDDVLPNTKKSFLTLSKHETYEDVIPSAHHHLNGENTKVTAFVSIQRGCDNFCSFCVVPFTRGRERSKAPTVILQEVQALEQQGIKMIVLLGQNVNSYFYNGINFLALIEFLLQKSKIELFFFTSPHPKDFPLSLLDLIGHEKRLASYVHIPLQAGSDRVLKNMHRGYNQKDFLELINVTRKKINDVVISTDVIVGFPQESDEDFQETLRVMEQADFDTAFMFAYSERKGTLAQKNLTDDVPLHIKQQRLQEVIRKQLKRGGQHLHRYVNNEVEVLAEDFSRRNEKELVGKMRNSRKVVFSLPHDFSFEQSSELIGSWLQVKIKDRTSATLLGEYVLR